ncbi:MAG: alpha/beta hydrolase [Bacteroidales bacterium]|nr:alpha/beta hydrolase [Bacteroidales bacterium]
MRHPVLLFLFLNVLIVSGGVPYTDIPEKPYENSRFAVIDSLRIHYRVWNEDLKHPRGKVLLIHGFCGSTFCWRNNYDTLANAGYMVVAIDLPGFGYSGRNAKLNQSQSNRGRMIWKLLDIIDDSDTTKWNIAGHSMGGGTAEAVALMKPERTQSLTIVAGMIFLKNGNINQTVVGLVNHPVYKRLLLSYTENNYLSFNNFRRELKGTYGFLPDTVTVRGYWEPLQIDGTSETVVNMLANSNEIQKLDARGLSRLPVQAIWGRKDRTIRLSNGRKLKRVVPSVELKVIPDARHMPMETHPEEFNQMLIEFLDRNNK